MIDHDNVYKENLVAKHKKYFKLWEDAWTCIKNGSKMRKQYRC